MSPVCERISRRSSVGRVIRDGALALVVVEVSRGDMVLIWMRIGK